MALSRHNSVISTPSSTSTPTVTSFTAAIGEIVVVQIAHAEVTTIATVSSISDGTANVYAKLFAASRAPAAEYNAAMGIEIWWAYCANTLTSATITITM